MRIVFDCCLHMMNVKLSSQLSFDCYVTSRDAASSPILAAVSCFDEMLICSNNMQLLFHLNFIFIILL